MFTIPGRQMKLFYTANYNHGSRRRWSDHVNGNIGAHDLPRFEPFYAVTSNETSQWHQIYEMCVH